MPFEQPKTKTETSRRINKVILRYGCKYNRTLKKKKKLWQLAWFDCFDPYPLIDERLQQVFASSTLKALVAGQPSVSQKAAICRWSVGLPLSRRPASSQNLTKSANVTIALLEILDKARTHPQSSLRVVPDSG